MTAWESYVIRCDHRACLAALVTGHATVGEARRDGVTKGWVHKRIPSTGGFPIGVDFCPEHTGASELSAVEVDRTGGRKARR